MNEFTVDASVEKLDAVLNFVNAHLKRNNCPAVLQNEIDIAVEEIFVNIAHYAYKPLSGKTTMAITVGDDVVLSFEDSGSPYNPLEQADPDLGKPLMEREIGGLGVFLVKKLMDKIEYARLDDKNVLTMRKKLTR